MCSNKGLEQNFKKAKEIPFYVKLYIHMVYIVSLLKFALYADDIDIIACRLGITH